jgi:hypothetical protein
MKAPSLSTIVLCALGIESAMAMPSMHNVHRQYASPQPSSIPIRQLTHRSMHRKKDVNFNNPELYKGVDWKKVFMPSTVSDAVASTTTAAAAEVAAPTTTTTTAPPALTTSASAPASPAASSSSSSSSGGCSDSDSDGFCTSGFGGQTTPVNNGNVDQYKGNVGNPWGSNIQTVDGSMNYKYMNEFQSTASADIKIVIWNKSGPDGQPNSGQFSPPALSFTLSPGSSQSVAFDENSQVAWCHDTGEKTAYGAYDCTFGEADFGNLSNGGWSGYDVSSIQNSGGNDSPMTISCPNGETSSNTGNGYISDTQAGGIGGNLAPGKVRLTTHIG